MDDYETFLNDKQRVSPATGIDVRVDSENLFPFQRDVVSWSVRRGRAAVWGDCGLGKTRMALEWAATIHEHTGARILILTPLAVAHQFAAEGTLIGIKTNIVREAIDVTDGINITNYERLDRLDSSMFGAVVLDESSILKNYSGKVRTAIIEAFVETPYKLACTATPSPNDLQELGNHAEFLGVMSRTEMLATFFVHDGGSTQSWRIKGHAAGDFWAWVGSWAVAFRKPSDIGHSDEGYDLPALNMHTHTTESNMDALAKDRGLLFAATNMNLHDQRRARRLSMDDRVSLAAGLVNDSKDPWVVWCDLNDESTALAAAIEVAVEITGSQPHDEKIDKIKSFSDGRARVVVTKPSICGFGVNWQHCSNVVFVGVTHSFESWYQAIRRVYRFGQKREVECHIVTSSAEVAVIDSLDRKREMATAMIDAMSSSFNRDWNVDGMRRQSIPYQPTHTMTIPKWMNT